MMMRRCQGPPRRSHGSVWGQGGGPPPQELCYGVVPAGCRPYGLMLVLPVHSQLVPEVVHQEEAGLVAAEPAEEELAGVELAGVDHGQQAGGDGSDWPTHQRGSPVSDGKDRTGETV